MNVLDVSEFPSFYVIKLQDGYMRYRVKYFYEQDAFTFEERTRINPKWEKHIPDDLRQLKAIAYWVSGKWK